MLPHLAFIGNAFIFMLMASFQFGVFDDLFDDDEVDEGGDVTAVGEPTLTLLEDTTPDPLFDASFYDATVDGTAGPDRIIAAATDMNQAYFLGAGDDVLDATPANDFAQGGSGDDRLIMREGDDIALGGSGNDNLAGGVGDDILYGGDGNDALEGSIGDDRLEGGNGDDQLSGGRDSDVLIGGAGDDLMTGDRFDGTGGIGRGVDTLFGEAGDDTLWLYGQDTGTGGEGADMFRIINANDGATSVTITDYDGEADQIEVVYSEVVDTPAPELSVTTIPDTTDAAILLDGVTVATISGGAGLVVDDVVLTPTL